MCVQAASEMVQFRGKVASEVYDAYGRSKYAAQCSILGKHSYATCSCMKWLNTFAPQRQHGACMSSSHFRPNTGHCQDA